jgi:pyridoxal phosphate enzyme (YggS family)
MMNIHDLELVRGEIAEAETKAKREKGSVTLMAVSKLHPYEDILQAYHAGQRLFGENHVQEILEKFPSRKPEGMELHLIGHLQMNKVKKVVSAVEGIDSVDSFRLLQKIDAECAPLGKVMPVLLEFNTSGEEAKSGFPTDEELFSAISAATDLPHISIRGLMTVGPLEGGEEKTREAFRHLKALQMECRDRFPSFSFSTLSMGMSADFPIAIQEGSTMVRVGTRIFGVRNYAT